MTKRFKDYQFKKGQSGNRKGRKPGSINKRTLIKKYLSMTLRELSTYLPAPIAEKAISQFKDSKTIVVEAVIIKLILEALIGKPLLRLRAAELLFDRAYGKPGVANESSEDALCPHCKAARDTFESW